MFNAWGCAQRQQSPEPARAPPQRARSKRGADSFAEDDGGQANGRKRSRVRPLVYLGSRGVT